MNDRTKKIVEQFATSFSMSPDDVVEKMALFFSLCFVSAESNCFVTIVNPSTNEEILLNNILLHLDYPHPAEGEVTEKSVIEPAGFMDARPSSDPSKLN